MRYSWDILLPLPLNPENPSLFFLIAWNSIYHWSIYTCELCGAGLQKCLSFSAIRTKHKTHLDMLSCVSKHLLYRRGNSTQQHLNEITKNKQGKAVQLIFEMKETPCNHKQYHSNFEIEHNLPWTDTTNLRRKALWNFPNMGKWLQFNKQQPEAIADETTWTQWLGI